MMNEIYSETFQVRSTDVDMYRQLKLSSLFTRFQEAAIADTIRLGVGREMTLDKGFLWVVAQQTAKIARMPVYDEKLTLRSWPGKMMHLLFPRYWEILDEQGETIISASSLWVLINQNSRQLVFPEENGIQIDEMKTGSEIPLPLRIRPKDPGEGVNTRFTVPVSFTDLNGHMNNARYFDLAADLLADPSILPAVREVCVDYIGEIRFGQTMTVHRLEEEGSVHFYGEMENAEENGRPRPVFRIELFYRGTD